MSKATAPAGNVLFGAVAIAALAVLGWALWSLPGWLEGWRLSRTAGVIAMVAIGAALLLAVTIAAAFLYALLGMLLEGLGVPINIPKELTGQEEARAAATQVHAVWYIFNEEDAIGYDVCKGVPVAVHTGREAAEADRAARSAAPAGVAATGGRYDLVGPWNLLAACLSARLGVEAARELLRSGRVELAPNVGASPYGFSRHLLVAPLTRDELRRAGEIRVWTVYYEDRFSGNSGGHDSYPVVLCFSAADAQAEMIRLGPLEPRSVGHSVSGPGPLAHHRTPEIGADRAREVFRRLERGESGPLPLR